MTTSADVKADDFRRPHGQEYSVHDRLSANVGVLDDLNAGFRLSLQNRKYGQQFANLYYMRLEHLKPITKRLAEQAWSSMVVEGSPVKYVDKVLDISAGDIVWVVGTIYREMRFKPNILEDVSRSKHYGAPPILPEKYFDKDSDEVLLEDESGRLRMTGERVSSELLVTGCVVAVLGTETSNGDFHVMDIKFPEYAPQPARMVKSSQRPKYLAIASGLELDGKGTDDRKVAMLTEFLSGEIGGDFDQHFAADVTMLILAGSTIGSTLAKKDPGEYSSDKPLFDDSPIAQFDEIINKLASSLPVAVMPGDGDPVNLTIPQQPFHKALFHSSKRFLEENNNLVTTTNPFWWEVDGVRIFGSSGQMINDIYKYSEDNDRLRMLDYTLRWRNCAPTAPDTLYTYPFVDKDPFIMNETPHVYFAGNQPSFATKVATGRDGENNDIEVRLIAVPRFSQTGQVVVLNLDTLEARPVTFQCD